jgi:hypothetical protein
MAQLLDVDVEVFAGYAWTARHGWYAMGHDPRLWTELVRADAVVLALGHFDTAPSPLPNLLWRAIPQIYSPRLRRLAQAAHARLLPELVRVSARLPGGGPVALRPPRTVYYLQSCVNLARRRKRDIAVVGMTPISARAKVFSCLQPGWAAADRAVREWGALNAIPTLDLAALTRAHMLSDQCNPDGMHFGWEGHLLMGQAMAELIRNVLEIESVTKERLDGPSQRRNGGTPNSRHGVL